MKMMRKFYMLAAMAAVAAVSCKRADLTEDLPVMPQGKPLTVEACLDKNLTRTTMDSDGLTLLWEAGDQLAVYSSFIGSEASFKTTPRYSELYTAFMNSGMSDDIDDVSGLLYWIESGSLYPEYQKNGILTVTDASAGSAQGTFTSENTADAWFGKSDSAEDENYWFTAYYPAPSQEFLNAHPIKSFPCGSEDMGGVSLNLPWVMVNVPSVQDGKSWSRYQIVVCSGFDFLGFEDDNDPDNHNYDDGGIVSRQGFLNGSEKICFASFQPLTSLLHFNLKVGDLAPEDSYYISKIVISQEAIFDGNRYTDLYALSGDVPYFMFCNAPDRDDDTTLWNRYCKPVYVGNNLYQAPVGEAWSEGSAGLCNTITLQFDEEQKVTKDGTGEDYYAVAIPTNAHPDSNYDNPKLVFSAYDSSDNLILRARLKTPNRKNFETGAEESFGIGLEYGHKYDFTVTLNTLMDGEAGNAGEYNLINW